MDLGSFEALVKMVTPQIEKKDTVMRETLIYLSFMLRISWQALSEIVMETCQALYKVLKGGYLSVPRTKAEWQGSLDGKHVNIQPPEHSGSQYHNYKGNHSIVLMALVDADLKCTYVDVDIIGRVSDERVLEQVFPRPGTTGRNILKAYPRVHAHYTLYIMMYTHDYFYFRLSRARSVENAFGVFANRWCVSRLVYTPPEMVDCEDVETGVIIPGQWCKNLKPQTASNAGVEARWLGKTP
uniref:DDE Tnp4 domain-containing protein n=1 Tax=Salmo trutta TaxID=8032 RepID=A0A673VQL5_SALTR